MQGPPSGFACHSIESLRPSLPAGWLAESRPYTGPVPRSLVQKALCRGLYVGVRCTTRAFMYACAFSTPVGQHAQ
jgi:hypothetical protein